MMTFLFKNRVAPAAAKSLALEKDGVFRLLVIITALLGWVLALGAGGVVLMQNVYSEWALERSSSISIYLMADAPADNIKTLQENLVNRSDVNTVQTPSRADVAAMIQPFLINDTDDAVELPLPVVMRVGVQKNIDYGTLSADVQETFPNAEIDDARALLATVANAVRLGQLLAIILSVSLFIIMAFLVTITVRTGLRAQEGTLAVLRYIGSTDAFLGKLVVQQVVGRALVGWSISVALAGITFIALIMGWPLLQPYSLTPLLPIVVLGVPLILPLLAHFAAKSATNAILK